MRRAFSVLGGFVLLGTLVSAGGTQSRVTLVDNSTPARYNRSLGNALNGTQPQFPPTGGPSDPGPTVRSSPEPNLSSVASILGNWLARPPAFSGRWSAPEVEAVASWPVGYEEAVVYEIDGGAGGLKSVVASIGVDNGTYVWANGVYKFGASEPGEAVKGEYTVNLGDFPPGKNYVQVLREDHGGRVGYTITITGVRVPAPQLRRITPDDLRRAPEFQAFYGFDDPVIPTQVWEKQTRLRCKDVVLRVKGLRQSVGRGRPYRQDELFPGETRLGEHSTSLLPGIESDFRQLLDSSLPPSDLEDNVFVQASAPHATKLRSTILSSRRRLEPADVLELALKITGGNYQLAVLTSLNVIKEAAFQGRQAGAQAAKIASTTPKSQAAIESQRHQFDQEIAILRPQANFMKKLVGLRANPLSAQDKAGPWYHAFTILTVGALYDIPLLPPAKLAAYYEHLRKLKGFADAEAPFNFEKFGIDTCFANAAGDPVLQQFSR